MKIANRLSSKRTISKIKKTNVKLSKPTKELLSLLFLMSDIVVAGTHLVYFLVSTIVKVIKKLLPQERVQEVEETSSIKVITLSDYRKAKLNSWVDFMVHSPEKDMIEAALKMIKTLEELKWEDI